MLTPLGNGPLKLIGLIDCTPRGAQRNIARNNGLHSYQKKYHFRKFSEGHWHCLIRFLKILEAVCKYSDGFSFSADFSHQSSHSRALFVAPSQFNLINERVYQLECNCLITCIVSCFRRRFLRFPSVWCICLNLASGYIFSKLSLR